MQEAKASYKCMDDNSYNRDACLEYFKAYKECKKQMVRTNIYNVVTNTVSFECIMYLSMYTTLHHFLSISLDEQRSITGDTLLLCKICTIIVCTKLA